MPKKRTQKTYFGEDQEQAVVRYLTSNSEDEKNRIFEEYLREPLNIMVESIIRRYKLYRKDYDFEDLHTDTMSFLITKIDKFDVDKNYKSYSYFGTICKNYLMGSIQKDVKDINRSISYDDISSDIEDSIEHSYDIDSTTLDFSEVIGKLVVELTIFMETEKMNENERKLGYALLDIFNNFETIFQIGDGNKFNKNLILLSLRDMTSLSTKEIRISMKKYKKLYKGILNGFLS